MEGDRQRASPADLLPLAGLLLLALLALAWADVLPGGWRLRSLFGPDAARQGLEDARHAAERRARFSRENAAAPAGAVVFLGSSTIERFPIERAFPGKPCLNRGIANASALELRRDLADCLPRSRPAGIVIYAGAVDWRRSGRDAEVAARNTGALLDAVEGALAGLPVALIGFLPERRMSAEARERLREADARLAELARGRGFAFVRVTRPPISGSDGSLAESLSADDLHLDEEGYAVLARWIVEDGGEVGRLLAP